MSNTNAFHERIETIRELITKLNSGKLSIEELDVLVNSSRELYERAVVLQYKAFEEKVFGQPVSVQEPIREEIVETLAHEEEQQSPEPEIIRDEQPAFDFSLFDEPQHEEPEAPSEPAVEEHVSVSHTVTEEGPIVEETIAVEQSSVSVDNETISSMMSYLNRELEKHTAGHLMPKLDTLVGSFGLNERLQFINELFNGSSEDFTIAVSELDTAAGYSDALARFAQLVVTRGWAADSETVLDFLTKVKRRHA